MPIGLEDWFMNFTQIVRSAVTPESLANVPRPYSEFAIFGTLKGGEIASFIGGCIVHPIYYFVQKRRLTTATTTNNSYKIIRATCRKLQGRFLIGGLVLGPVASMIYSNKRSADEMKEICYRIRCSEKNMILDRTSLCLGFVGWYWKRFQGAVDGINIALAYTVLRLLTLPEDTSNLRPVESQDRLPHAIDIKHTQTLQSLFHDSSTSSNRVEEDNNKDGKSG